MNESHPSDSTPPVQKPAGLTRMLWHKTSGPIAILLLVCLGLGGLKGWGRLQ